MTNDEQERGFNSSLLFLHLITPDVLYDFGVGFAPAAEVADGERQLDLRELFVGIVQGVVCDGAEMILD